MKEDTVAGLCINQKKLVGVTVQDMIQGAGGNGVEVPQAPSFPAIYSRPRRCLSCLHASCGRNREAGQLCRVEESNPDGWLLLEDDSLLMAAMVAEGCTVAEGRADNSQTPQTRAAGGCARTKAYQPGLQWPVRPPGQSRAPWEDTEGRGRGRRGSPRTLWGRAPSSHGEAQKAAGLPVPPSFSTH